jgi:DNA-binding CsgD family transcriptional regulator
VPTERLTEQDQERVLGLSWTLGGARSVDELATAALEEMQRLIGAEGGCFLQADLTKTTLSGQACFSGSWASHDLIASWGKWANLGNPIYAKGLTRSTPFSLSSIMPISELPPEFYEISYKPWDVRYQAIVPIQVNREALTGIAYSLVRCSRDFASRDMSRLYALQMVLAAHHAALRAQSSTIQIDAVPNAARLTQRERQVLTLVASGMTAVAIGHALRISPGTVRKHVENSYSKLGVHDRLEAISRCRAAGLVA